MLVAKKYQDELKSIKQLIEQSKSNFDRNCQRYQKYQKLCFESALSSSDYSTLQSADVPQIEFNILNSPVDRLCGEFSKQQPSVYVSAADGKSVSPEILAIVEGHLRHILYNLNKDNTQYNTYRRSLSGGFSMLKCFTDYRNEFSFDQDIFVEAVYEPTMCGFDPVARSVTKSDAEYYWELFPMPIEEFKEKFPSAEKVDFSFSATAGKDSQTSFNWAYKDNKNKRYVVVCEFYRKKYKSDILMLLSNGYTMLKDDYEDMIQNWQGFEQPPLAISERKTQIIKICRYRLSGQEVLSYEETPYKYNNIIFVDGNSVVTKDDSSTNFKQFTKPYIYHAKGIQQLVNLAGQQIANDFENMVQHKFMICEEAIPEDDNYRMALKMPAKAQTLVYRAFLKNDPSQTQLPPIQPVPRVPLPPEVVQTFENGSTMLQNILGSYDAQLGIQQNQLSGVAIVEGATQSNAAAMPYAVNYMHALEKVSQWCVDMIPKTYTTPRTIPIIDKEGNADFIMINNDGGVKLVYDSCDLNIKVEAGVNFTIAKNQAVQQMTSLMQVSPAFAQLMGTEEAIAVWLDNLDFRGVDIIKDIVKQQVEQKKQNPQPPQPDPNVMMAQAALSTANARTMEAQTNAAKAQADIQEASYNTLIKAKQIQVEQSEADTNRLKVLSTIGQQKQETLIEAGKLQAEEERTRAQTQEIIKESERKDKNQEHSHIKDILNMQKNNSDENSTVDYE